MIIIIINVIVPLFLVPKRHCVSLLLSIKLEPPWSKIMGKGRGAECVCVSLCVCVCMSVPFPAISICIESIHYACGLGVHSRDGRAERRNEEKRDDGWLAILWFQEDAHSIFGDMSCMVAIFGWGLSLHSNCLRKSGVLKYSGMGSSYRAMIL